MINLPAAIIVLFITALLVVGVRESARFNAVMVAIKLVAVVFFIPAGFTFVKPENWSPFMPYGFSGVMAAAAVVFFAYIGFDAVSTTAEEAKNPQRDLPIGIIASLVICTLLYLAVSAVLTGILPVVEYKTNVQFLNAPVGYALAVINQDWAAGLVSAGAVCGITSVLLVMLMSQPRIFFAMSRDRLLPPARARSIPKFKTPYVTTIITGVVVSIAAALVPIQILGEMTSIGTLFAFMIVCAAVMVLRVKRPEAQRPFKVRGRSGDSGAGHRLVPLPDAEPSGGDVGPLPRLAQHRHADLLVLRPRPQPAADAAKPPRAPRSRASATSSPSPARCCCSTASS